MSIELPKDAEGREIPLDTEVLYDRHGNVYEVACYVYAVRQTISRRIWDAKMLNGTIRYTTSLHLTPPDSWEKLEEDLGRGADALNYEACAYFGKRGVRTISWTAPRRIQASCGIPSGSATRGTS